MREFEKKRKSGYFMYSYLVIVPLILVLFFLMRGTWNLYLKDKEAISDLESTKGRLEKLVERQNNLTASLAKLSTESGVEGEIRDRLQMVKEGEKEIIIVKNEQGQDDLVPIEPTILQKIIDFFTIR